MVCEYHLRRTPESTPKAMTICRLQSRKRWPSLHRHFPLPSSSSSSSPVVFEDEANARKHEPLMYKKFCATKTSAEAKTLLITIRNRQRALHLLEAMTYRKYVALQHSLKVRPESDVTTLRSSLSGAFLQTLPDLVTPLKGHSLSARSCPATRSAPSERFGY